MARGFIEFIYDLYIIIFCRDSARNIFYTAYILQRRSA